MEIASLEDFKPTAAPGSVTSIGMYNASEEALSAHHSFRADQPGTPDVLGTSISSPNPTDFMSKGLQVLPENEEDDRSAPEALENSDLDFIKKVRFDREKYFRLHFKIERPEEELVEEALQHFEKRYESGGEGSVQARTYKERRSANTGEVSDHGATNSIDIGHRSPRNTDVRRADRPQLIIQNKKEGLTEMKRESTAIQGSRPPYAPKNTAKISLDDSRDLDFLPRNVPRLTEGGGLNPYRFTKKDTEIENKNSHVTRQASMPAAIQPHRGNQSAASQQRKQPRELPVENGDCFCQELANKFDLFDLNLKQGILEKIFGEIRALSAKIDSIEQRNLALIDENQELRANSRVKCARMVTMPEGTAQLTLLRKQSGLSFVQAADKLGEKRTLALKPVAVGPNGSQSVRNMHQKRQTIGPSAADAYLPATDRNRLNRHDLKGGVVTEETVYLTKKESAPKLTATFLAGRRSFFEKRPMKEPEPYSGTKPGKASGVLRTTVRNLANQSNAKDPLDKKILFFRG
jgi:hypothetical protein